jgi:5'-nucleotidase
VAHRFSGIPVIESFSYGQAFGRVDLQVDPVRGKVVSSKIFAPQRICRGSATEDKPATCETFDYEGAKVEPKPQILESVRADLARADALRQQPLGPVLSAKFTRSHGEESAVGNLFAALVLEARGGDVALANGGGLRADLPAGPLTFGALFEAFPFDNRVATVRLSGAELKKNLLHHLTSDRGGIVSLAGMRVVASCAPRGLQVDLFRDTGARVKDDEPLTLVTSDFIVLGGDDVLQGASARGAVTMDDELVRDAMVRALGKRKQLAPADVLQPGKPRIVMPGPRPVSCGKN